jgi:hypothetical protein
MSNDPCRKKLAERVQNVVRLSLSTLLFGTSNVIIQRLRRVPWPNKRFAVDPRAQFNSLSIRDDPALLHKQL